MVLKNKKKGVIFPIQLLLHNTDFLDYARSRGSWNPNTDLWIRLAEWKNKGETIVAMEKVTTLP